MNNSKFAPIIVFVYARAEHTKKTLEALSKNKYASESDLFIFSDAARNNAILPKVEAVRKIIKTYEKSKKFKSVKIFNAESNKGLANSVISGVTQIINIYGRAIVVEDDLITENNFIEYMNDALNYYQDDSRIWSISGYNIPINMRDYTEDIYLSYRGCSWGWATWKDRWNLVDWAVSDYNKFKHNIVKRIKFNKGGNDLSQMLDFQMQGRCDSWAIRWCYQQFKEGMYTIYPKCSLIKNIGLDGSGTHLGNTNKYDSETSSKRVIFKKDIMLDKKIARRFKKQFNGGIKQIVIELLEITGLFDILFKKKVKK